MIWLQLWGIIAKSRHFSISLAGNAEVRDGSLHEQLVDVVGGDDLEGGAAF